MKKTVVALMIALSLMASMPSVDAGMALASDKGKVTGSAVAGVGGAAAGAWLGSGAGIAIFGTAVAATGPFAVLGLAVGAGVGYIIGDQFF